MNKTTLLTIFVFLTSFCFTLNTLEAQSTLEYGALVSGVASATTTQEANQNATTNKLYSATPSVLSKSGDLLSQEDGATPNGQQSPTLTETITKKDTIIINQEASEKKNQGIGKNVSTKVFFKDGTIVEGKLIGYINNSIQIDVAGAPITYFNDDIRRIEEYS
jgi:hypothetical protein